MITVVTITFNNFEELISTYQTIPKCSEIDHLVINGGSCKRTLNFLNSEKVHHISENDKGISDAFNKGVKFAKGEYIIFINSGDILTTPDYLFNSMQIFKDNQEIDFIYSSILFQHQRLGEYVYSPSEVLGEMPFPHPSLVVKKKLFEETGLFSLDYLIAMDFDFAYRLKKLHKKGHFYSGGPVVKMDGSGVSSQKGLQGIEERIDILSRLGFLDLNTRKKLYMMWTKEWFKNQVLRFGVNEDIIDWLRGRK